MDYSNSDWSVDMARRFLRWKSRGDGTLFITRAITAAFRDAGIVDVVLPRTIGSRTVSEIGPCAFDSFSGPSSVKANGGRYHQPRSLTVPDTVHSIGRYALSGLDPQTIYIPASVRKMGDMGFGLRAGIRADACRRIEVDPDNTSFLSREGSLYDASGTTLLLCAQPYAQCMRIDEGVRVIGKDAFSYGSAFPAQIMAPDVLREIGSAPSRECLSVCAANSVTYGALAARGLCAVSHCYVRQDGFLCDVLESKEAVLVRYEGCSDVLDIPDSIDGCKLVALRAGALPERMHALRIPDTVRYIGGDIVGKGLCQLKLPSQLLSLGPRSFTDTCLDDPVVIPATCTEVGEGSFFRCECVFEATGARVRLWQPALANCFCEGEPPFDFARYDACLLEARAGKEGAYGGGSTYAARKAKRTLERERAYSALFRLAYPAGLSETARCAFSLYLERHVAEFVEFLFAHDAQETLAALIAQGFFSMSLLETCLESFYALRYAPGIAQLLEHRHQLVSREARAVFAL